MSRTMTMEVAVPWHHVGRGSRKELGSDAEAASWPGGRVPRVSRLMALALRLDELVRSGQIGSYSELALLGQVTVVRAALVGFATGLRQDEAAVRAALVMDWSNGPVEGQVNRLKVIKRQMYGRAGLRLLRARVVNAA